MTNIGYPTFPGLHEAVERLNNKTFGMRHIEQLWRHLVDGEAVAELAVGSCDGFGVLAITNRRLVFLQHGRSKKQVEDFPLSQVRSIDWETGWTGCKVKIAGRSRNSLDRLQVEDVDKKDAARFISAARGALAHAASPHTATLTAPSRQPRSSHTAASARNNAAAQLARKLRSDSWEHNIPPQGLAPAPRAAVPPADTSTSQWEGEGEGWYVPKDGNNRRFVGAHGLPTLRLIPYRDSLDEHVLRLCEDATGLLVGPTDMRLPHAGILVSQLRGEAYHQDACCNGDFTPGVFVKLVPEPGNPHDDRAVAVYDATGIHKCAYMNKQKARAYLKRLRAGEHLEAISIRGTPAGVPCTHIAILAAAPGVIAHLLSPRPPGAPPPAHQR